MSTQILGDIARANLLALADAYGAAKGLTREQVSARFYGNRVFLDDFARARKSKKSKSISIDKYDEMWSAIIAAWPEDAERPTPRAILFRTS